jgi:hypothetical protein
VEDVNHREISKWFGCSFDKYMKVPGALWVHQLFHVLSLLSKPYILIILQYGSCCSHLWYSLNLWRVCAVISYIVWNTLPCLFFFLICLYFILCYCALQIQVLIYSGWNYFLNQPARYNVFAIWNKCGNCR